MTPKAREGAIWVGGLFVLIVLCVAGWVNVMAYDKGYDDAANGKKSKYDYTFTYDKQGYGYTPGLEEREETNYENITGIGTGVESNEWTATGNDWKAGGYKGKAGKGSQSN